MKMVPLLIALVVVTAPATAAAAPAHHDVVRDQAQQLVLDGQPGVIVVTRQGHATTRTAVGVADLATGERMRADDHVHIGSITKTFVATVVLQLVREDRLQLDAPLSEVLPGVLAGTSYDPRRITVRMLLQHTGGIRDYLEDPRFQTLDGLAATWTPQQLVDVAMRLGPGVVGWHYSNTDYVLAGMIVQRVTGHPVSDEITRRIIEPLHLRGTSFPLTSTFIPTPYAHGYFSPLGDVTHAVNPSTAGAAGAMISTADDVATFYRALFGGRLLGPAQSAELERTVPANDDGLYDEQYGLGVYRVDLPCGPVWGHDGGWPGGYKTFAYSRADGARQTVISYNDFGVSDGVDNPRFRADVQRLTATAVCDS